MIEIKTNNLNNNELKELHKLLCAFHKIDYGLTIDSYPEYIIARMEEM